MLVDARKFSPSDYARFFGTAESDRARLPDDFCHYIADSLEWIPTINPTVNDHPPQLGLNFHGPTVILPEHASHAAAIFKGWADLFRQAPASFELTVNWKHQARSKEPRPSRFDVDRDSTVRALSDIAAMATQVSRGDHFLLHFGL
ncbi:MAG TPA: hypothetical protein PKN33_00110 [Phycisphaerae bacterium]|nr:hypothetical protein [Phycisphaerae bacterium]